MKLRKKILAVAIGTFSFALLAGGVVTTKAAAATAHGNCENYCLVCDVAEKVNALPDAGEITLDNALSVTQQIHNIDRIKFNMTDDEYDEFESLVQTAGYGNVVKYDEAVQKVRELNVGNSLYIQKKFDLNGEALFDTSQAEVSFEVENLSSGQTQTLTLFDLGCSTSALGADYYQMTADGWTFRYLLPDGEYAVREINLEDQVTVNGEEMTFVCQSTEVNGVTFDGNGGTVSLFGGESNSISFYNVMPAILYVVQDVEGNPIEGVELTDLQSESYGGIIGVTDDYGEINVGNALYDSDVLTVLSAPTGYCIPQPIEYFVDWSVASGLVDADGNEIENLRLVSESYNCFTLILQKSDYINGFCQNCGELQPATKTVGEYDLDGNSATEDTVYEISNAGQLYWFAKKVNDGEQSLNGVLKNDIVVNEDVLTADGQLNGDGSAFMQWTPIGTNGYSGNFFGFGYKISGLYFKDDGANGGLFDTLTGKVNGVGVTDGYFSANLAGGIAAASSGEIINCYNENSIEGVNAGGIVGELTYNAVRYCYNKGYVSGSEKVGGIVGKSNPGTVEDCYNTGEITNGSGIAGYDYADGALNCYYLDGTANGGIEGTDVDGKAAVKSAEAFASGEVTYLLNKGVTDGTQVYYQTIGEDDAPTLVSARDTVYFGYLDCAATEKTYANQPLSDVVIAHEYGELVEENPVTCEADGMKAHYHCAACGKYFDENQQEVEQESLIIPALGHNYGEWEYVKEPTINEGGERKKTCANCGDEIFDSVPSNLTVMIAIAVSIVGLAVVTLIVGSLTSRDDGEQAEQE